MTPRPPSRLTYALRALVDVALHQATGPVTVASVAKRQQIPTRSLEQLFHRLKRRGLVEAERGPRGGYRLSRPAGEVSVQEVVEALDARPVLRGRRAGRAGGRKAGAGRTAPSGDPAAALWRQVEEAVQSTLRAATLETLLSQARVRGGSLFDHRYTFHI